MGHSFLRRFCLDGCRSFGDFRAHYSRHLAVGPFGVLRLRGDLSREERDGILQRKLAADRGEFLAGVDDPVYSLSARSGGGVSA